MAVNIQFGDIEYFSSTWVLVAAWFRIWGVIALGKGIGDRNGCASFDTHTHSFSFSVLQQLPWTIYPCFSETWDTGCNSHSVSNKAQ